jgi:predicted acylesterase/phospholipase RssA
VIGVIANRSGEWVEGLFLLKSATAATFLEPGCRIHSEGSSVPRTGVALSGGGHRASLFGLGVLQYLSDARVNRDVVWISSVSGGSITNAYIAQILDYKRAEPHEFESAIRPLARQISSRGTIFAVPLTWVFLAISVVTLGLIFVAALWLPSTLGQRLLVLVAGVLFWAWLIPGRRGAVLAHALRRIYFSPMGAPTRLADISTDAMPVFCATELQTGDPFYFAPRFVYGYRFAVGAPGDLDLAAAVQASANFPYVFPPRWLRSRRFRFSSSSRGFEGTGFRFIVLSDGGVFNNMATQWVDSIPIIRRLDPSLGGYLEEPDEVIVADASARADTRGMKRVFLPLLGEVLAAFRIQTILYNQTLAPARRGLVNEFELANLRGRGIRGVLLQISQSPFEVPERHVGDSIRPDRAIRARHVIHSLGDTRDEWRGIAECNSGVATVLSKLDPTTSAMLMYQGYVLAMSNLHVLLGLPLLPIPPRARFESLVA